MRTDKNLGVPPATNRGAENTSQSTLTSLVDWVQCTFKTDNEVRKIIEFCGLKKVLDAEGFEERNGKFGYRKCLTFDHINFFFDGNENMGVHVEITGQGCRNFEKYSEIDWSELCRRVFSVNGQFTRLDIAVDDIAVDDQKPFFTVNWLRRKIKRGLCKSKMKTARYIENIYIKDGETFGETLYVGAPSGRLQIRFYEKDYERLSKGYDLEENIVAWNRTEIQTRKERANKIAEHIANETYPLGKIAAGILSNYINFLSENETDSNKSRNKIAPNWKKFLGECETIKLTQKAPDKTLEDKKTWLDKQVKKSLGMVYYAVGSNIEYLVRLAHEGLDHVTEKDIRLIDDFQENQRLKIKRYREKNHKLNMQESEIGQLSDEKVEEIIQAMNKTFEKEKEPFTNYHSE